MKLFWRGRFKQRPRRARVRRLNARQSAAREAQLRARGYGVERVRLPNGDVVVLRTKGKIR
jgi:hypothetical protein